MEANIQQENEPGRGARVVALLALFAGLAAVFVPLLLLVVPALWAHAMSRTKPAYLALFAVPFGTLCLLTGTATGAVGFTLAAVGAALCVYYLQKLHMGNAYTALAASGCCLLGLYVVVCLPGILSGEGAFAASQRGVDAVLEICREALAMLAAAGADPEAVGLLESYYDAFSAAVPSLVVAVLCGVAGVAGLSNLLFYRLFSRKFEAAFGLAPMRPFRFWEIPRSMTFGLFLLLIGTLVLEWTGWAYAEALSNTVDIIVGMPLLLQGLCVVDFALTRKPGNVTGRRVAVYLATGLLFSLAQMPLMLVGCMEQIFRLRARSTGTPPIHPLKRL